MKRYSYKINDQHIAIGRVGQLVPISVHQVVPGDTIRGSKEVSFNSRTIPQLVKNRTFLDVATFYIPYRLIQPEFPAFLIDGTSWTQASEAPIAAFFEKATANKPGVGTVWPATRMAYNLIWNTYFRRDDETEVALDSNTALKYTSNKSNDFFTSEPEGTDSSFSIGSTVDSLRTAVAKDNFNKARKYYGERYTDYLAAMGVDSGWSINDEPELIKHSREVMMQNVTKDTGTTIGLMAGGFASNHKHPIPKRFFPEHGLILTVAAWKAQKFFKDTQPPWNYYTTKEEFWSPEYDADKERDYEARLWNAAATIGNTITLPNFEELRKGMNMTTLDETNITDTDAHIISSIHGGTGSDISGYKDTAFADFSGEFGGTAIGTMSDSAGGSAHWSSSTISRFIKRSAVGTRSGAALR